MTVLKAETIVTWLSPCSEPQEERVLCCGCNWQRVSLNHKESLCVHCSLNTGEPSWRTETEAWFQVLEMPGPVVGRLGLGFPGNK